MKLIVGLGNPGSEYRNSRHNVGFDLIDLLSQRWSIDIRREKFRALFGQGVRGDDRVMLFKPQMYMNRSGLSVAEAVCFYKASFDDVLVAVDDMALELGRMRLRTGGSAGGHNGLKDIIASLGSKEFTRLRVGIGQARPGSAIGHVLGDFDKDEREMIDASLVKAAEAIECWLDEGIDKAMTKYNVWNRGKGGVETDDAVGQS